MRAKARDPLVRFLSLSLSLPPSLPPLSLSPPPPTRLCGLNSHRVRGVLLILGRSPEAEKGLGRGGGQERRGESRDDGGASGERRATSRLLGLRVFSVLERSFFV